MIDPLFSAREALLIRLSSAIVCCLALALIGIITCPFVDWSDILLYDGSTANALNGKVVLSIRETELKQLTGSAPTQQRRVDETWFGEARCATNDFKDGPLCTSIRLKVQTSKVVYVALSVVGFLRAWALAYFSLLLHRARWRILKMAFEARVGACGCLVTEDGLSCSWKGWARDPCAFIVLLSMALGWGGVFGLMAWPIGMELFKARFKEALPDAGVIEMARFDNDVLPLQEMGVGYNMFAGVLVLTLISIALACPARNTYRLL